MDDHIPRFFLYGEPPRPIGETFLHLESLDERSRPTNWNIRPHTHANLSHVIHISHGGGRMRADTAVIPFTAPGLLIVPSSVVHGFVMNPDTQGAVLTLADAYLHQIISREAAIRGIFEASVFLPTLDDRLFPDLLARLSRELAWTAIGHAAAVEALLTSLLIEALRIAHQASETGHRRQGAHAALVARFREMVEARHRVAMGVDDYARELSVTPKRLRAACLRAADATPGSIIQDRILLEAKRLLLYSNMTVAEVGYHLGFSDPAYFTRAFSRGAGVSPRRFRAEPALGLDARADVPGVCAPGF